MFEWILVLLCTFVTSPTTMWELRNHSFHGAQTKIGWYLSLTYVDNVDVEKVGAVPSKARAVAGRYLGASNSKWQQLLPDNDNGLGSSILNPPETEPFRPSRAFCTNGGLLKAQVNNLVGCPYTSGFLYPFCAATSSYEVRWRALLGAEHGAAR
jgi:hypothetical protein